MAVAAPSTFGAEVEEAAGDASPWSPSFGTRGPRVSGSTLGLPEGRQGFNHLQANFLGQLLA